MNLPFHPLINEWFSTTYGKPTSVQNEAWPLIASGKHVLAIAPTGSGKTLTGFLSAISRFTDGTFEADRLSVLYVSPLKALNEDIKRNLILPLESIKGCFEKAGTSFPSVRVETRSGDTTQTERRRFLISPPSILALTPESLAILLLNRRAREHLSHVKCLILDEIHASLGNKRGAYLACQVDRLSLLAGEFQRIALSATVNPKEAASDFIGGLIKKADTYKKRRVSIVAPPMEKNIFFSVVFPQKSSAAAAGLPAFNTQGNKADESQGEGVRYEAFIDFMLEKISKNRSTLIYTDSRRRAERICYLLNKAAGTHVCFTHHGSLSKELRRAAEKALAEGNIPCVVATSSLELGIDIGSVDEVVLAGSPFSASSALQRTGRSGHRVGEESRGYLYPFHGLDLIAAAAIAGAVEQRELEQSISIENPLDVLSQIVLAHCTEGECNEDELYETIRGFYVFRNLPRDAYDSVVRMLSGGYEDKRMRELPRRIYRDSESGVLSAASGTIKLLYTSGGVIANRGYYSMRLAPQLEDGGNKIGELDEEFVWERRVGDCFNFGGRAWRIGAIGVEAVEVYPLPKEAGFTPFWKADALGRGKVISRRILEILDSFNIEREHSLSEIKNLTPDAEKSLLSFLKDQISFQGKVPLTGHKNIAVEIIDDYSSGTDAIIVIIHSFRGSGINYPLSLCLQGDIEEYWNIRLESTIDNNAVMLRLPRSLPQKAHNILIDSIKRIALERNAEKYLGDVLASSGVFNSAFRESAEASLLLPRSPFGKRIPLWVTRQKSKRLFDAVSQFRDFPVTTEALRTCLNERFDMEAFKALIRDLNDNIVSLDFFVTRYPSPFSRELVWLETSALLYEYDDRKDLRRGLYKRNSGSHEHGSSLSDLALAEALIPGAARPALEDELVKDFCSRLRREKPGWTPEDALSLCEWVKERVAIPCNNKDEEWEKLLEHIPAELTDELQKDPSLGKRITIVRRHGAEIDVMIHRDWQKLFKKGSAEELAEKALEQWFRSQGPVPISRFMEIFGFTQEEADKAISYLIEAEALIPDLEIKDIHNNINPEQYLCDRENLELLLRLSRKKRRESIKEYPGKLLVPFLAQRQGLFNRKENTSVPWDALAGFPALVKLWETEILPARCDYRGDLLDTAIREGRLIWYGAGKEKIGLCSPEDLDLALPLSMIKEKEITANNNLFKDILPANFFDTPKSFWQIKEAVSHKGGTTDSVSLANAIWKSVWQGLLSSDSFEPLRRAAGQGFKTQGIDDEVKESSSVNTKQFTLRHNHARIPRHIRERWKGGPPIQGNWYSIAGDFYEESGSHDKADSLEKAELNPLAEDELNRARVRLLLKRLGFLCRPLLENESPAFSWSRLLPAMRRMELAGELVAGRFFSGINSLQFAPPGIAHELALTAQVSSSLTAQAEQNIFWMNAADPASPCGISALTSLYENSQVKLPARLASSRICFKGTDIIAVTSRNGKTLEIDTAIMESLGNNTCDKNLLDELLTFISFPRLRKINPEKKLVIEKINGISAASSLIAEKLKEKGFVSDRGKLVLW